MNTKILLIGLLFFTNIFFINGQEWTSDDITIYRSFDDLEEAVIKKTDDYVYVINFWATWCGPCVKELPHFESLNDIYKDKKVKIVLVSLDFEKHIEKRLMPFLNKNKIQSEVVLLLDPKESEWIDRVDPSWSGSIPITIVKDNNESKFYEQVFHSPDELKAIVDTFLKKKK